MTNRTLLALSAVLLVAAPGLARAGDDDPFRDDGSIRYRFYTGVELLYVERDRTPDVEISWERRITPTPRTREVISTDEVVDDDQEFGGRFLLGFRIDPTSSIEAAYMGWGHESSVRESRPVYETLYAFEFPDLTAQTGLSDSNFDAAAEHRLRYDEDFHSAELNYRHALEVDGADYRFNLLAGLRAIRLEEDLDLRSLDDFNPPTDPIGGGDIGKYEVATRNTLIGAQFGVESFVPLWKDLLEFDLLAVAGGYANQAKSTVEFSDPEVNPAASDFYRDSRSDWDAAGVFEGAAHLKVRLWRGVRLNMGYRVVYLVGIAAAPDQFPRSGGAGDFFGNTYDNDGATVFHGPSLALSADF